jgi:hypothetical protein
VNDTPVQRRTGDPYRPIVDAIGALLVEHPQILDTAVEAEIARRIEAGLLIVATQPGPLTLIKVAEEQALRTAISRAIEALDDDDVDSALDALERYRPAETPDAPPTDQQPEPAEPEAPTDPPTPRRRRAAAKTTKKATKKAAPRARRKVNLPSTDGSDVQCSRCDVMVEPMNQVLSAARTKPADDEQVLCRTHLAEWSEEQERREKDRAKDPKG